MSRAIGNSSGSRVMSPGTWSCGMSPSGSIRPSRARIAETRGMASASRLALQRLGDIGAGGKLGIEQPVGVVEGRAEQLAAGQVLVGRRHAPLDQHGAGVDRAWCSRSAAAWCDRRAPGRSPRSCRRAPGRWRAPPVRGRRASLRSSPGRRRAPAARRSGRGAVPAPNGRRAGGRRAGCGHWRLRLRRLLPRHTSHASIVLMRVVRGRQAMPSGAARMMSTPRGKRWLFCFHCSTK